MRVIITLCTSRIIHHMPGDLTQTDLDALGVCIWIAFILDLIDLIKTIKRICK